jgi:hypothetical protein
MHELCDVGCQSFNIAKTKVCHFSARFQVSFFNLLYSSEPVYLIPILTSFSRFIFDCSLADISRHIVFHITVAIKSITSLWVSCLLYLNYIFCLSQLRNFASLTTKVHAVLHHPSSVPLQWTHLSRIMPWTADGTFLSAVSVKFFYSSPCVFMSKPFLIACSYHSFLFFLTFMYVIIGIM